MRCDPLSGSSITEMEIPHVLACMHCLDNECCVYAPGGGGSWNLTALYLNGGYRIMTAFFPFKRREL